MSSPYKHPQYPLRIPRELILKLRYIADSNARTTNKEIEFLVRKYIADYEDKFGEISLQQD